MTPAAQEQPRPGLPRSAALTAASSIAAMGLGAVVALLVLLLFGSGARTDAFFAAYGVYALLVSSAQGLRVALVARLPAGEGWAPLHRFAASTVALSAAMAVPMVVLGPALARLLVGDLGQEAVDVTRTSLALLWAAGTLQLLSGLLSAALAARADFGAAAAGYVAGAVVTISALLLLAPFTGIVAVALAVLAGTGTVSATLWVRLRGLGWRWRWARPSARSLSQLLGGTVNQLTVQLAYLISLACAARLGAGSVTNYSYAFFGVLLLLGATAGPASIVLAGPLADAWDRRPATLTPQVVSVSAAAFALSAPALAAVALVGGDLLAAALAGPLDAAAARDIAGVILALSLFVMATAASTIPLLACFALGRYGRVTAVSAAALVVHLVLSVLALRTGEVTVLALAASGTAVLLLLALLALLYGRQLLRPASLLMAALAKVVLVVALSFGPQLAVAQLTSSLLVRVPLLLVSLVAYAALARVLVPATYGVLRQLLRGAVGRR